MAENLKQQATSSAKWQATTTAFQAVARLVVGVVLARLLPPEDFGVVGFALIFTEFLALFSELGVGAALVQREALSQLHLRVGFTLSAMFGSACTLLLWLVAPLLASGTTLTAVRMVAFSLLLTSLGTVSTALLYRQLAFRRMFFVELISYLPGYALITIALAWQGYGVWSLVTGLLTQVVMRMILVCSFAPHSRKPSLASAEAQDLLHFGTGMTLARLASYGARNADYLVVGYALGPAALGLYLRAFTLGSTTQLASLMTTVLFPIYARTQDDPARTKRWYLLANSLIGLVTMPTMALLAVTAPEVLRGVYGPAWSQAAVPLQWFAVVGTLRSLYTLSDALARAHARVYRLAMRHLAYALLVMAGALAGLRYNIAGVAAGASVAVIVMFLLMSRLGLEVTPAAWRDLLAALRVGAVLALAVAATSASTVWLLRSLRTPDLLLLLVAFTVAGFSALAALRCLPSSWYSADILPLLAHFLPQRCLGWLFGSAARSMEGTETVNQNSRSAP